jgi:hypothetical protein
MLNIKGNSNNNKYQFFGKETDIIPEKIMHKNKINDFKKHCSMYNLCLIIFSCGCFSLCGYIYYLCTISYAISYKYKEQCYYELQWWLTICMVMYAHIFILANVIIDNYSSIFYKMINYATIIVYFILIIFQIIIFYDHKHISKICKHENKSFDYSPCFVIVLYLLMIAIVYIKENINNKEKFIIAYINTQEYPHAHIVSVNQCGADGIDHDLEDRITKQ